MNLPTWAKALSVLLLTLPLAARAEELSEQRTIAREAIAAMHTVDIMKANAATILERALLVQIKLHPEQAQFIAALKPKLEAMFVAHLPELANGIADVYASEFTTDELRAIVTFYHSPVGIKLATSAPDLLPRVRRVGQAWGQSVVKEFYGQLAKTLAAPSPGEPPAQPASR